MKKRLLFAGPVVLGLSLLAIPASSASASGVSATKTITSLSGSSATSPGTSTGTITLTGLTPGTTYTLVDAYQALPEGAPGGPNRFFEGTYTISLTSCTGATSSTISATEVIGSGGVFPGGPAPANTGAPMVTASASTVTCDYTVALTGTTAPAGMTVSDRNDLFVLQGTTFLTQTASASVTPPFGGTSVPMGAVGGIGLAAAAGLGLVGYQVIYRHRRRNRLAA
jgi:hypothetical protein